MISIEKIGQKLVKTSYKTDDCIVLLKDLTDEMVEIPACEREKLIQNGVHYSELLPEENEPSKEYETLYNMALENSKKDIAKGIAELASMIVNETSEGKKPILVSLARAGIPIGVLLKRYIKRAFDIDCPHYAISIIRGKGIDKNAMNFIYNKEIKANNCNVEDIIFIDGWTGKGMIKHQLNEAVLDLKREDIKWKNLSSNLFVLADPANLTKYCATREDYFLPSSCLNSTVSGLTSRTILNSHIDIEEGDFHGACYFDKFKSIDKSNEFIDTITNEFDEIDKDSLTTEPREFTSNWNGLELTLEIAHNFGVDDFKKIKPGIGETTRVLLRRVPWKVLINKDISIEDKDIQHILMLCKEKKVPIERYSLGNYKVVGIIKELSADA